MYRTINYYNFNLYLLTIPTSQSLDVDSVHRLILLIKNYHKFYIWVWLSLSVCYHALENLRANKFVAHKLVMILGFKTSFQTSSGFNSKVWNMDDMVTTGQHYPTIIQTKGSGFSLIQSQFEKQMNSLLVPRNTRVRCKCCTLLIHISSDHHSIYPCRKRLFFSGQYTKK